MLDLVRERNRFYRLTSFATAVAKLLYRHVRRELAERGANWCDARPWKATSPGPAGPGPSCKALRNRQHELERQSLTHPTPCDELTLLTARVHQNFDALQTGQLSAQHGISWLV